MSSNGKTSNNGEGTYRFFFPDASTREQAVSVSRQGSYAAVWGVFSAIFTAIMVLFVGEEVVIGERFRNQDLVLFLISAEALRAVIFAFCAFLVWRSASLISAIISFVLIFSEIVVRIIDLEISAFSWLWLLALLGASNGIRGTKALRKKDWLSSNANWGSTK
ncbi:MAG: hypothetical protein AAF936_16040 [Pseudomonadota bacterium]